MAMFNVSRRKGPAIITKEADDMGPKIVMDKWMSHIPDDRFLSRVTIPGTHNTMSFTADGLANHWVWCQAFDLWTQLDMGVRFLDIRCRHFEGSMSVHHGKYYLGTGLGGVYNTVHEWLKAHPTETVIMSLQHEMQESDKGEDWVQKFIDHMEENFMNKPLVWRECRVPKMGEVRGKITVIVNYPCYPTEQLSWGQHLKVENDWSPGSNEVKFEKVKKNIEEALAVDPKDTETWYLTMCSYSDNEFPCNTADRMNNCLLPYLHSLYGKGKEQGAGIIAVDYPGYQLINAIVSVSSDQPWKPPVGWEKSSGLLMLPAIAKDTPFGDVPGKTAPGETRCWYGYGGEEHCTENFKLVGGDVKPDVQCADGNVLKCAIVDSKFGYCPGKTDGSDQCWYTYDGKEYKQKGNFTTIAYAGGA
eukprot:GHVN01106779.1.p1 GENE.GHVN01106779.1~~GHVN01106779.1.p1  ORF type:complete len:439 (+),score=54.65 GHVN01106779.1:72-1319(+)